MNVTIRTQRAQTLEQVRRVAEVNEPVDFALAEAMQEHQNAVERRIVYSHKPNTDTAPGGSCGRVSGTTPRWLRRPRPRDAGIVAAPHPSIILPRPSGNCRRGGILSSCSRCESQPATGAVSPGDPAGTDRPSAHGVGFDANAGSLLREPGSDFPDGIHDFRRQGLELFAQFSPYCVPERLHGFRQSCLFHQLPDALSVAGGNGADQ